MYDDCDLKASFFAVHVNTKTLAMYTVVGGNSINNFERF